MSKNKDNDIRKMTTDEAIISLREESNENCGIVVLTDYFRLSQNTSVTGGYLVDMDAIDKLNAVAQVYSIYTDYEQEYTNRQYYIAGKNRKFMVIEIRGLDIKWDYFMNDIDKIIVYEFCSSDKLVKSEVISSIKDRLTELIMEDDNEEFIDQSKDLIRRLTNELKRKLSVHNSIVDQKPCIFTKDVFIKYYINTRYKEEIDEYMESVYDKGTKEIKDIMEDKSSAIYSVSEDGRIGTMYDRHYDKVIEFSSVKYHDSLCDVDYYFFDNKSDMKLKLIVRITNMYSDEYDKISYKIDKNYFDIDKSSLPTELSKFIKLLFKDIDSDFVVKYWENVSLVTDVDGINPHVYSKDEYFNTMGRIFANSSMRSDNEEDDE